MIKLRNLDNSLVQWIMTVTGLGPGIGNIKYVVPAASATSQFRTVLQENGVDDADMFTSLTAAEAAVSGYRNDVILALPGAYDEALEIDWDKPWTHIIGLGGPNCRGDHGEPNVIFYTDTAGSTAANLLDITGQYCQFRNVVFANAGNNGGNLCAVKVNKYGLYFENVGILGCLASSQKSTVACSSLYVHTDGHYPIFKNCSFGEDCWGACTGSHHGTCVRFTGSQPNDGHFIGCVFRSDSTTVTTCHIAAPLNGSAGRNWCWDDCFFYNYNSEPAEELNEVFYIAGPAPTHGFAYRATLRKCTAAGFDEWTDADNDRLFADMPITGLGGGLVREPTATAGS